MSSSLSKIFDPKGSEKKWYKKWVDGDYFAPKESRNGKNFSILMPPPNVTGVLHAGHALDITTQDALIRFKRMKGYKTVFLPGMDHAGIATQSIVEKAVQKEEGKTRHDFSREEFLKKIWSWKKEYGGIIADQQRAMGTSAHWDWSLFTMDPEANEAVKKVFVDLYNEGLIYQADYIINWDPALQSAISDAEVDHVEVKGNFYHLHYKVKDSDTVLEIATTRPETLLGDTGVAVNPNDDRFKHLIGKTAIVPLCHREVPIVGDEHVDIELGTGCLKVTPGHDFNDFEIGRRHNLPVLNILNKDGTLNELTGKDFEGLSVKEARKVVLEALEECGQLVKVEPHTHQVGHGERSGEVIEPMVSKQWFVNVQDMAAEAVSMVEDGSTTFYPKTWENTYFSWLREPKNWCISRQLWWGHRIPVFTCHDCHHEWASTQEHPESCPKCKKENYTQDPDVLDTWFSSGLWPLSTLGWPDPERMKERSFDDFFPSSVLITGFDIIFFWVARMMMMTLKTQKSIPFKDVYVHAIVRDKQGRKMSKSLGNGLDPLEMVDQYGADAFRFTLASGAGYNRTINLDPARIEGYRNFVNKIWNAFRFIHPYLEKSKNEQLDLTSLDSTEKWILSELNETAGKMNKAFEMYRYDDACQVLYQFIYEKFCSWFIEISKSTLNGSDEEAKLRRSDVLRYGFKKILALLHPVCPYITEELWQELKSDDEDLLIVESYPEFQEELVFTKEQAQMESIIRTVSSIRNLRASVNMNPKEQIDINLFIQDQKSAEYLPEYTSIIKDLVKARSLHIHEAQEARPSQSLFSALSEWEIFIPGNDLLDIPAQIKKIEKEIGNLESQVHKLNKKLSNEGFRAKAPKETIEESEKKLESFQRKLVSLKDNLKYLQ